MSQCWQYVAIKLLQPHFVILANNSHLTTVKLSFTTNWQNLYKNSSDTVTTFWCYYCFFASHWVYSNFSVLVHLDLFTLFQLQLVYVYITHFGVYSSIGVSLNIQSIFISSRFSLFRVNSESMSFEVTLLRLVHFFTFSWLLLFLVFEWHDRFPGVLAAKRHFIFDRFCGLKIQQDSQSSLQFIINI